jgi:Caspase domain
MTSFLGKRSVLTLAVIFAGPWLSAAHAFQEPAPGVIHALLVGDSNSSLGDSVVNDVRIFGDALWSAFSEHPGRLRLHSPLVGDAVTVAAVESFFAELESGPDDTLLFFFSGHGEVHPELGHALNFTNADHKGRKLLSRADLLASMRTKNARLVVVLTDCCSTIRQPRVAPSKTSPRVLELRPPPKWAVAGCLLLQHRGVVDITASCPGQAAWPDSSGESGLFTSTFAGLLAPNNLHILDQNKDGFVEWNEFYPELAKRTQQAFVYLQYDLKQRMQLASKSISHPEDALSEDENLAIRQPTQKSWTCSILPFLRLGVRVVDSPEGLRLAEIYPGTPASIAQGLQAGCTIVGIADTPVQNENEFVRAVDASPGDMPLVFKVKGPGGAALRTVAIALRDNDIPPGVRVPVTPTKPKSTITRPNQQP